jgi:hypothetical protein
MSNEPEFERKQWPSGNGDGDRLADDPSSIQGARRERAWRELGFAHAPEYLDESTAPPLDHELIRRVVREEASKEEQQKVIELELAYKSWAQAVRTISGEELDRIRREDPVKYEALWKEGMER